ncbi:hypothetical protein K438DRAFT_2018445 [Mycena galopus ATCC 62051]|nr:hypothetical protein K438DRAFT_2018445 [Mycena galopus ATCC 62051]
MLSSRGLSERDARILVDYGRDTQQDLLGVVVESIFCSVYGVLFAVAVYSIFRKGLRSRASIIMLVVVVFLYMASVIQWALDFASAWYDIHYFYMVPDVPIPERGDLGDSTFGNLNAAAEALFVFNMIIGDSVVIWRTWAIYGQRMLAIAIPCILLLVSFVFNLIDIVCASYDGPLPGGEIICPVAARTGWAFSAATNIVCTILVALKAWQHRKIIRALNLQGKPQAILTEHILVLLVESGFIYGLLWLAQIIAYLPFPDSSPLWWVYEIIAPSGDQIAGMYPTLIIVVVNFKRTMWDESAATLRNPPRHSDSLSTIERDLGLDPPTRSLTSAWKRLPETP